MLVCVSMYEMTWESELMEIIPVTCTSATWGQSPGLSHSHLLRGVPLGVAAVSDGLMTSIKFPTWLPLQGSPAWGGCNGLCVCNILFFYYTHIWQATLLLLTSSIREDKGLRISLIFLKTFNDFLWHWQKIQNL